MPVPDPALFNDRACTKHLPLDFPLHQLSHYRAAGAVGQMAVATCEAEVAPHAHASPPWLCGRSRLKLMRYVYTTMGLLRAFRYAVWSSKDVK